MAAWPATLPQSFDQDSYTRSFSSVVLKTDMSYGPPKRRRRTTAAIKTHSGTMIMSLAQYSTFLTWFETTAGYGTVSFDFPDPFNSLSTFTAHINDDWTVKDYVYNYVQVSLSIEEQP